MRKVEGVVQACLSQKQISRSDTDLISATRSLLRSYVHESCPLCDLLNCLLTPFTAMKRFGGSNLEGSNIYQEGNALMRQEFYFR